MTQKWMNKKDADNLNLIDVDKASFPYDRPDRPSRLKNVHTIETIIWKRYPDDPKRPGRLRLPRSLG